ncbi:hypothetical protein [Rummeliibacillus stabekisii]|uniref:hypothetical protein n=1 Tax=Rummeliibacillus stabekisii TaxID=241244 RepID=UPI00116E3491|nr:hypothetical protein [Rummeliibacillus stabekisii]MBB5168809.1 hypothetical protein [Rummeliibacillus stabekisii]GEL05051.1 hypothetical protein RST01_16780 [Rummeliibacillus stabekisii]
MSKKRTGLRVATDLNGIFADGQKQPNHREDFTIEKRLSRQPNASRRIKTTHY